MYMRNLSSELERETQGSSLKRELQDARKLIQTETQSAKDALRKLAGDEKSGQ